jgi:2-hydroxychromene-2-carboxylate isomerase
MDFIAPMLYGTAVMNSRERFDLLVKDFAAEAYGRQVYAGIHADYASFAEIEARINMARRAGCQGQAIFAYSVVESRGYWDELRAGPYAQPAMVP